MNFGQALEALKAGRRVARSGWNGKGMWLRLHDFGKVPTVVATSADEPLLECAPYIEMRTADTKIVPWLASQTDILAEDWGEVAMPSTALPAAEGATKEQVVGVHPRYMAPMPKETRRFHGHPAGCFCHYCSNDSGG